MDSECPVLYVLICVIASSMESTIFTEMIASRYSVPQSSSVAGMISELIACALSSPRISTPCSFSFVTILGKATSAILE